MQIIENITDLEKVSKGCVLTIGNFDGVHLGHQQILAAARQAATERTAELVAMTFEPHPFAVLHPEKAPGVLTPLKLKEHLLADFGADCLIVLKDSVELLNLSPPDFVDRFLVKNIHPSVVVEGEDFNFGAGRTGTIHTLYNLGQQKGFEVSVIEAKEVRLSIGHAVRVSSTMIRNLLEAGKVADAAIALGRPYRLIGKVVPGRGIGKSLGFPTANIQPARQIIPAEGVFAGYVAIADTHDRICQLQPKTAAVFSIGRSTTFSSDYPLAVEAHLLEENIPDLTDKWLAMDFVEFFREQQKFETQQQLSAQIEKDCQKAKQILRMN